MLSGKNCKIIILMPYFGKWPEWINLFLKSCEYNSTIEWLFFTDCPEPVNKCKNVNYVYMTLREFNNFVCSKLKVDIDFNHHNYTKTFSHFICDLKPFLSYLFEDYVKGYDYWGWGDIDVIYGDIRKYFKKEKINGKNYDVITFHKEIACGSLTFIKNSLLLKLKAFQIDNWRDIFLSNTYKGFEECYFPHVVDKNNCYFKDSYNTPSMDDDPCPTPCSRKWIGNKMPTEWYWMPGKLTNNIDGEREFLFLHFMVWKGGIWGHIHGGAQWEKLDKLVNFNDRGTFNGFKINEKGFFLND